MRGVLLALAADPPAEVSVGWCREGPFPLPEGEELLEATEKAYTLPTSASGSD